jgi:putative phosphoribosyl transferase
MFSNRSDAGRLLAQYLTQYSGRDDVVVLGIPRGGVPVAFEVATKLHAPLDILLVRKIGAPEQKEFAIGAVASGGVRILNQELIEKLRIPREHLTIMIAAQEAELHRREQLYRGAAPHIPVRGKTVILVDDGIATGSSMLAALSALRSLAPARIVVATPVSARDAADQIEPLADEFICLLKPRNFFAIGEFYEDFAPTQDADVRTLLQRAANSTAAQPNSENEVLYDYQDGKQR